MQYRHPTGARLALTSGHVTRVGPEWKELDPMFHAAALNERCEVDQSIIPAIADAPLTAPSPQAVVSTDEFTVIRRALETMIERDEDGDFTPNTQLPSIKVLEKLTGTQVSKSEVYRIYREMKAEAEASAEHAE